MAYSDFTFAKLKEKYSIQQKSSKLFQGVTIQKRKPSDRLKEDIEDSKTMPLYSEKAKSEAIIFPIIRELKKTHPQISIFSGYTFNVSGDLAGAPDFLISSMPNIVEPQSPVFCLVESKNKTPEEGFAQCAAEMYAAQLFNEKMKEPQDTIYGAVTNGFDWVFLKLNNKTVWVDMNRYYLIQIDHILGIFDYIISSYKKEE